MTGFPSTRITSTLRRLHKRGVDILGMSPQNIARASKVKLKDVQCQLNDVKQYVKFLDQNFPQSSMI